MAKSEEFFLRASHFPQEYFVYSEDKWCGTEEKGPLLGRFDGFLPGPLKKGSGANISFTPL